MLLPFKLCIMAHMNLFVVSNTPQIPWEVRNWYTYTGTKTWTKSSCCWRSGNHNAQSFHCSFIISRTENSNYNICLHILQPDTLLDMFCSHILDHITGQCATTHTPSGHAYLSIPRTGQANLSGNSGETLNVKLCMLHVNIELLSYLWLCGELVNVHRTSQPFASRSRKHKLGTKNTP
jgi:hypothetical protein